MTEVAREMRTECHLVFWSTFTTGTEHGIIKLVQSTADQWAYLSKSKKVTMERVTVVIEVKSNFHKKFFIYCKRFTIAYQ